MAMLGIYRFDHASSASDRVVTGSQGTHTIMLTVLFASLGLACEFPQRLSGASMKSTPGGRSNRNKPDPVFEARQRRTLDMLQSGGSQAPPRLRTQKSNISSLSLFFGLGGTAVDQKIRGVLLTALQVAGDISWTKVAEQYIVLWGWATSRPSVVGFFLALMATVCPSWLALGVILAGLALLVLPERWTCGPLLAISPALMVVFSLWTLLAQLVTASTLGSAGVDISDKAKSLGLYVFPTYDIPYLVPLGSMILAVAALAGFSRRRLLAYKDSHNAHGSLDSPFSIRLIPQPSLPTRAVNQQSAFGFAPGGDLTTNQPESNSGLKSGSGDKDGGNAFKVRVCNDFHR